MGYRNLRQCVDDLLATGRMVRIDEEVDPHLEAAEIHRRVVAAEGPALYFARVKDSPFPLVSNLFGTMERTEFMFRDALNAVRRLLELKVDPSRFARRPLSYATAAWSAWSMLPKTVRRGPVLDGEIPLDGLPQVTSWPDDGGAFITLPMVYTEDVERPGMARSNVGMYRIQLGGGEYERNREVGLHYQIHRGIGVHHAAATGAGKPLEVNVFVGGPPAMMLAAVMPLPEGVSELGFAGALARHRMAMVRRAGRLPLLAEADFCVTGRVDPHRRLPEGPFGDHLGYYSLVHDFPVLEVDRVYHRSGAIWPFTVVGRPPQEDTIFGKFIHELTGPVIPALIPGLKAVHAVDAAGVHPLLLAIGSERYVPYQERERPQELLTIANAILGQGQLSLAKYLLIVAHEDRPDLDIHDIPAFFAHLLSRVDWRRDLHFQTQTTIDTLDYSGGQLNAGSKLVIAAVGPPRRELPTEIDGGLSLPEGFRQPRVCLRGVLAVAGPPCSGTAGDHDVAVETLASSLENNAAANRFPLVVVVDDSEFASRSLENFLWVTFTRSNPAADVYGVGAFIEEKHWGCRGALVIDARRKPHHAPPCEADPEVARRVERLGVRGGPLEGVM